MSMLSPYPDRSLLTPLAPPILAKETRVLPHGEDWIYEFLWGGERVRGVKRDGGIHLLSRDGRDCTNRFPRVAASIAKLRVSSAIIDGEILYLDSYPAPAIRFLAEAADDLLSGGLAFLAYDLLCDDGKDVRQYSLLCRRLLLAAIIQGTPLVLSPLINGNSAVALASAARLGFRGVVAKRAGSPYRPNSLSTDWVKITFGPTPPLPTGRFATAHPFTRQRSGFENESPSAAAS